MNASEPAFRVGFVPGVTPDKWARIWAERMPRRSLDLVPLGDRDGLHLIPLYDEQPVVMVAKEHPVAAFDEIDVTDLADEHLLQDPDTVPQWRDVATEVLAGNRYPVPEMSLREAVESVAADAGTGALAVGRVRRPVVRVAAAGPGVECAHAHIVA